MAITEITYKTNKNLGNMEHESVELTYQLKPRENVDEVFEELQATAFELLGIETNDNAKPAKSSNKRNR